MRKLHGLSIYILQISCHNMSKIRNDLVIVRRRRIFISMFGKDCPVTSQKQIRLSYQKIATRERGDKYRLQMINFHCLNQISYLWAIKAKNSQFWILLGNCDVANVLFVLKPFDFGLKFHFYFIMQIKLPTKIHWYKSVPTGT